MGSQHSSNTRVASVALHWGGFNGLLEGICIISYPNKILYRYLFQKNRRQQGVLYYSSSHLGSTQMISARALSLGAELSAYFIHKLSQEELMLIWRLGTAEKQ